MPRDSRPLRVLFTTQPAAGHLRPLVPIALEMSRRGHDVRVCTLPAVKDAVEGYGLSFLPGGYDWGADVVAHLPRGYFRLGYAAAADVLTALDPVVTEIFAGTAARALARDALRHAEEWPPDLVVRESDEFGGYLAAEVLGIPHVSVASFGGVDGITGTALGPLLDKGRAELGLAADPDGDRLYAYLNATFLPYEYGPAEFILPNTRAYRHPNAERSGGRLPGWLAGLDHTRPFVFAGFGTVVYDLPGARTFLAEVIAALGTLDCTAVLAVGAGNSLDGFGPLPANVRLVDFLEQALILEGADLFITHGGLNSIKESLRLGVPMVGIPVGRDHRHNVDTCVRAGVARDVPVAGADAAAIAAACREVLTDPAYRARTRAIQRHIHALGPVGDLVDDLEAIADPGEPNS